MFFRRGKFVLITVLTVLLCTIVAFGCSCLGKTYNLVWSVTFDKQASDNVVISVEGYDALPNSVGEGTELKVKVEGKNGYTVDKFKVNNRKQDPIGEGKYAFVVSKDTEIEIILKEKVAEVRVPSLKFFAGEELNSRDVPIEVLYETGTSETTTKYNVIYQNEESDCFNLGDTYYTIQLRQHKEYFQRITLSQTVLAKVLVSANGGTISRDYVDYLRANEQIDNVAEEDDGSISFTFANALTQEIALPSASQVEKGEEGDFIFENWSTNLPVGTNTSVVSKAIYKPTLVAIDSVGYELRETQEGQIPCLVIKGTYKACKSGYVYLYEGNMDVEFSGETFGGENVQRGDAFEGVFDMRAIAKYDLLGAWFDVKLIAEVNGITETQEINLADYSDDIIDLDEKISVGGVKYNFQVYSNYLKVEAVETFENSYIITSELNDDGEIILTIAGQLNAVPEKYFGKVVKIDFEIKGGETLRCIIDEQGKYSVSINLFDLALNTDGYVHFYIVESLDDDTVIYSATENNLLNEWCKNTDLSEEYNGKGLITGGGIACSNEDGGVTYYVGKGKWGGIVVYGTSQDVVLEPENITLEEKNEKLYLVISGRYAESLISAERLIERFRQTIYADFTQGKTTLKESNEWITTALSAQNDTILIEAQNCVWKIYLDLSVLEGEDEKPLADGNQIFAHLSFDGNVNENLVSTKIEDGASVLWGDYKYSLGVYTEWGIDLVVINVKDKNPLTWTMDSASVIESEGKVLITIDGTYTGDKAKMEKVALSWACDLEENPYAAGGTWSGNWVVYEQTPTITINDDGTFVVVIDVTQVEWSETTMDKSCYTLHFGAKQNGKTPDVKLADGLENSTVIIEDKTYTLVYVKDSTDGAEFWGGVGLTITTAQQEGQEEQQQ